MTPLPLPVDAVAAADDPLITPNEMAGWAACTGAGFSLTVVPGGHLYLHDSPPPLARLLGGRPAAQGADDNRRPDELAYARAHDWYTRYAEAYQEQFTAHDEVVTRRFVNLSAVYDHRVVNGREAVAFLQAVKGALEAPDHLADELP